jgi:hypothetical protein
VGIVHPHLSRHTLNSVARAGTLAVPAKTTVQASATLSVPAGQVVGQGAYTDALILCVYNNATGVYQKSFETPFTASIGVAALATLATAGGGQSTTLQLGNLADNVSASVNLTAYSNQAFHLTLSSDNAGVLKLTPDPLNEGWSIPYTVSVSGAGAYNLATAQSVHLWSSGTPSTGAVFPLSVQVRSVAGKRAGIYRDVITIAIDPGA